MNQAVQRITNEEVRAASPNDIPVEVQRCL